MNIDTHQHFWKYDPEKYGWISDEMSLLKRDFLPPYVKPEMDRCNFSHSVAVQARPSEDETHFLLELADQFDFIAGVVGWVDLTSDTVDERLDYFSRFQKLKGIRHLVQSEPDDRFMLREDFLRGINALNKFNLTYDILIYPRHLTVATDLVKQFPGQQFVVDHLAKPFIKDKKIDEWQHHITSLAEFDHVYCKISGMVTEADWNNWKPSDFYPYLDVVIDAFGTERLMIGSDWPVCTLAADYSQVWDIVKNYLGSLNHKETEKLKRDNAIRFYDLDLPTFQNY